MTRREQQFICIGLLLVTTPTLINDWIKVPDFFRGALMGLGLGLEIGGLVLMTKRKRRNQDLADL
jgi:hypothetical protein